MDYEATRLRIHTSSRTASPLNPFLTKPKGRLRARAATPGIGSFVVEFGSCGVCLSLPPFGTFWFPSSSALPSPPPTLSSPPQFPCLNFPAAVSQKAVGLLGKASSLFQLWRFKIIKSGNISTQESLQAQAPTEEVLSTQSTAKLCRVWSRV